MIGHNKPIDLRYREVSDCCIKPDAFSSGFASEHSRPSKRNLKRKKKAAAKKAAAKAASDMAQHHWNILKSFEPHKWVSKK